LRRLKSFAWEHREVRAQGSLGWSAAMLCNTCHSVGYSSGWGPLGRDEYNGSNGAIVSSSVVADQHAGTAGRSDTPAGLFAACVSRALLVIFEGADIVRRSLRPKYSVIVMCNLR
jgi:hypothetical protein